MLTEVKERPILFSGPMVRAILDGHKTQTRRIITPQPVFDGFWWSHKDYSTNGEESFREGMPFFGKCPYGKPGERLWVRETCCCDGWSVHYMADNGHVEFGYTRYDDALKLHHYAGGFSKQVPSIHMPRWASRIDLEITSLRIERLNQITPEDAVSEGIEAFAAEHKLTGYWTTAFSRLWSTIHAADGPNGWAANPWVWVVEFRKD